MEFPTVSVCPMNPFVKISVNDSIDQDSVNSTDNYNDSVLKRGAVSVAFLRQHENREDK